jgi:hypothetical protein
LFYLGDAATKLKNPAEAEDAFAKYLQTAKDPAGKAKVLLARRLTSFESDAKTRAHSQSFREMKQRSHWVLHEAFLECDASWRRFRRAVTFTSPPVVARTISRRSQSRCPKVHRQL